MVAITVVLQVRLLDAARQYLGGGGETLLQDIARQALDIPFDAATYDRLDELFVAVEQEAPPVVGPRAAADLAAALRYLRADIDTGVVRYLIAAVREHLGPAAAPFLANACRKCGWALAETTRAQLPALATIVREEAPELLGRDTAQAVAAAIERAATVRPRGLVAQVTALAVRYLGPDGEAILRDFCRERLETDLDALDSDGLDVLARAIEGSGAEYTGVRRTEAFLRTARTAAASPAGRVHARLLDLVRGRFGPAGALFLENVCARNGLPLDAISYEHLPWLAGALRDEAAPLLGADAATALAAEVTGLLGGSRATAGTAPAPVRPARAGLAAGARA